MKTEHTKESLVIFERNCQLKKQLDEAIAALKAVVSVADRETEEFIRARAIIERASES